MRTEHCKRAVFTSLAGIPGIVRAEVRLGTVTVEHDGTVTAEQLCGAIAVAGYEATTVTAVTAATQSVEGRRRALPVLDG